ncbi:MAG: YIP1 family protein [Bacteroidales bacterium]|nr:YIP1 family protein [Bacteroidales bacterium]
MSSQENKLRPILSIWLKPRETFQYLETKEPDENRFNLTIIFVVVILGFFPVQFIENNENDSLLETSLFFGLLFYLLITLGLGLLVLKYFIPGILWAVGKILQGKADYYETQLLTAYSLTPNFLFIILSILFIIPALFIGDLSIIIYKNPITYFIISIFSIRNLVYPKPKCWSH